MHTAVTMQLDQTSVRVDETSGETTITILKQGQSELNVSLQVDTRVDTATGKNNARNSYYCYAHKFCSNLL